jgi:hypothetical protein
MLQRVTTSFTLLLLEFPEQHGGGPQSVTSNDNNYHELSWAWSVFTAVNTFLPLCPKMLFNFKNSH